MSLDGWAACDICGQEVPNTANGWRRHEGDCPEYRLRVLLIEASVTGSSQGVLSADIRRRFDGALRDLKVSAIADYERTRDLA